MSTFVTLTHEVSIQAAAFPAANGGILDWLTAKNGQTQTALRGVAITVGIIFIIWQAVSTRGAMARIIISIIAAGVFVWGVFNVTNIKDRVDTEVNASGPSVVQLAQPTGPGPLPAGQGPA